jgi:hypothetical protein
MVVCQLFPAAMRAALGLGMTARRFPPPWSVEDACFIVRDASGPRPGLRVWASGSHFAQYRTRQRWRARPRRSGTKRGLAAAYLIWIKKR